MSDSVKYKRPIQCPPFLWEFFISYGGDTYSKDLLYLSSRESFLKYQDAR